MEKVSEGEQVELWRYERFVALGFTAREALELAARGEDWHRAERLVKRKVPIELVRRIIL